MQINYTIWNWAKWKSCIFNEKWALCFGVKCQWKTQEVPPDKKLEWSVLILFLISDPAHGYIYWQCTRNLVLERDSEGVTGVFYISFEQFWKIIEPAFGIDSLRYLGIGAYIFLLFIYIKSDVRFSPICEAHEGLFRSTWLSRTRTFNLNRPGKFIKPLGCAYESF